MGINVMVITEGSCEVMGAADAVKKTGVEPKAMAHAIVTGKAVNGYCFDEPLD